MQRGLSGEKSILAIREKMIFVNTHGERKKYIKTNPDTLRIPSTIRIQFPFYFVTFLYRY